MRAVEAGDASDWCRCRAMDAPRRALAKHSCYVDQVMESLGLKAVVLGLQNRVGTTFTGHKDVKPKSKLEEKQALEEVMGRGDSICAKYAAKIFKKKMLAEARHEQAKVYNLLRLLRHLRKDGRLWQVLQHLFVIWRCSSFKKCFPSTLFCKNVLCDGTVH